MLPPGRYRAWIEYTQEGQAAEGSWSGRVRSHAIDIEIVAVESE